MPNKIAGPSLFTTRNPRLQIDFPQGVTTALQAEDAKLNSGPKFRRDVGWSYDSTLDWTDTKQTATWKLNALGPDDTM